MVSVQNTAQNEKEIQVGRKNEEVQLAGRLNRIKDKTIILFGKGGVGKSTVSANLAFAFCQAGKQAGLLDVDIHGPSISAILRHCEKN